MRCVLLGVAPDLAVYDAVGALVEACKRSHRRLVYPSKDAGKQDNPSLFAWPSTRCERCLLDDCALLLAQEAVH